MTRDTVAVILPALNEVSCVEPVVQGFLREGIRVIVVDNGSTDDTGSAAAQAGAEVVMEGVRGYGRACLAGISYLADHHPPIVVAFADCDGTLDPHEIRNLTAPIDSGEADVVLGRRVWVEKGALPLHQRIGNTMACILIQALYGLEIKDIPPYRALRWSLLAELGLSETTYGFPIETVALAARRRGRIKEVGVTYHVRVSGRSKVSGSVLTSLRAGFSMISLIVALRFRKPAI